MAVGPAVATEAPGARAAAVTYVDFAPSFAGRAVAAMRAWAQAVRKEAGAEEVLALQEDGRPDRFALAVTWASGTALKAHEATGAALGADATAALIAMPDERVGEPLAIGDSRPVRGGDLYILVHIDVIPVNLPQVWERLKAHASNAREEPGAQRYDVWRQESRPNHFTAVQVWSDREAWRRHLESPDTRAFRDGLAAVKGALHDERLYRRIA